MRNWSRRTPEVLSLSDEIRWVKRRDDAGGALRAGPSSDEVGTRGALRALVLLSPRDPTPPCSDRHLKVS